MLFKDISIIDENFDVQEHMYVGIKEEIIDYLDSKAPEEDYGEVYDGRGKLLIPCFYNAHSHLAMGYMRGYGENLPLMNWLSDRIFPFEAKMNPEDMYYGSVLGIAEMLRFGIGATQDMYLNYDAAGRALIDTGVKGCFSNGVTCFTDQNLSELPIYTEIIEAQKKFGTDTDDRVRMELSLHSEYTTTEKTAKQLAELAAINNMGMHVHVSETAGEVEGCRERHNGKSPVEYLSDCGIFDVPTVAAHCVHLSEADIAILKEKNVTVAANPKSNAKLGSGISDVTKLLEAGVNVAIGTDSVASNNNLNMLEEMRFFSYFQKARNMDSVIISPKQTLYAATRAGALAQGRGNSGLVKKGFKADITVFDVDRIYMRPVYDMLNNLILSASGSDVVLTMVDGKVLYKNGEYTTIDIEKTEYEFENRRKRIISEL